MLFEVAAQTDTGLVRPHNEDSFLVDQALGLFAVADGIGGHLAGEVASSMCVHAIRDLMAAPGADGEGSPEGPALRIDQAIQQSNQQVFHHARTVPGCANMGTTVVLLLFRAGRGWVAHVGDSRAYLFREGVLSPLTRDHSLLQEQIDAGLMSEADARLSHSRNVITRAMGIEPHVEAEIRELEPGDGDVFLLCTDGLNTMVPHHEMETILHDHAANLDRAASLLIQAAKDHGGRDNVTVMLVRPSAG